MAADPLSIDPCWLAQPPLLSLAEALDRTVLLQAISREELLRRLAADVRVPGLPPLLCLLPRRWRLEPALLPDRLRRLASILERGIAGSDHSAGGRSGPSAAPPSADQPSPLDQWRRTCVTWGDRLLPLPGQLGELIRFRDRVDHEPPAGPGQGTWRRNDEQRNLLPHLCAGLIWHKCRLGFAQGGSERLANTLLGQVLNSLAANLEGGEAWRFEGSSSGLGLMQFLLERG